MSADGPPHHVPLGVGVHHVPSWCTEMCSPASQRKLCHRSGGIGASWVTPTDVMDGRVDAYCHALLPRTSPDCILVSHVCFGWRPFLISARSATSMRQSQRRCWRWQVSSALHPRVLMRAGFGSSLQSPGGLWASSAENVEPSVLFGQENQQKQERRLIKLTKDPRAVLDLGEVRMGCCQPLS